MPELSPDELLTTTRSVRLRPDLTRPVERMVIEEWVTTAAQAPNAFQEVYFVIVADEHKRASLAEIYRKGSVAFFESARASLAKGSGNPARDKVARRVLESGCICAIASTRFPFMQFLAWPVALKGRLLWPK